MNDVYSFGEYYSDQLEKSIFECYTDIGNYDIITEKTKSSLFDKIKVFFTDLILQFENLIRDIRLKFLSEKRKKEFKKKVKEYYKLAKINRDQNVSKYVEMTDLWEYRDTYIRMNTELSELANKFSKVEYSHISEIDNDMKKFEDVVDKYSEKIKKILNRPILVPVEKMISFYENEITGRSSVMKTLEKNIDLFQQIEDNADKLKSRVERYGPEILPKQMNFIRKMCITISKKINSIIVKFFTLLILIF